MKPLSQMYLWTRKSSYVLELIRIWTRGLRIWTGFMLTEVYASGVLSFHLNSIYDITHAANGYILGAIYDHHHS